MFSTKLARDDAEAMQPRRSLDVHVLSGRSGVRGHRRVAVARRVGRRGRLLLGLGLVQDWAHETLEVLEGVR